MDSETNHGHAQSRDTHEHNTAHPRANQWINKLNFTQSAMGIIALIVGSMSLGGLIVFAIFMPWLISAETRAASAEAVTTSKVARTDARVALDDVQRLREALAAKGFNVQKEH